MSKAGTEVVVNGFLYAMKGATGSLSYHFFASDEMAKYGYILIGPQALTAIIPAGFNPITAQVAALEKQRDALHEEFHRRVAQINDQIAQLQCIELKPA